MEIIEVQVQDGFLRQIARTKPFAALSEIVWNSCDADATTIDVEVKRNLLSGIDSIEIADNGSGIHRTPAAHEFSRLGDSWKATAGKTRKRGRFLHGRSGQGRFKAFALGGRVTWDTQWEEKGALRRYSIRGSFDKPKTFLVSDDLPIVGTETWTKVLIENIFDNTARGLDHLTSTDFAKEFALYLRNYQDILLRLDGQPISLDDVVLNTSTFAIGPFSTDGGTSVSGQLDVVEWKHSTERSIYLCDSQGVTRAERSAEIRAPGFDFTAYLQSPTIDRLVEENTVDLEMSAELSALLESSRTRLSEHFRRRELEVTAALIDQWKREDIYPYSSEPTSATEDAKRKVFEMVAVSVHQSVRGFDKSDKNTKAFSFQLLKEAVETGPSSLRRLLSEIVKLPRNKVEQFDSLLSRTNLVSVIDFLAEIADRNTVIQAIERIITDTNIYRKTRERDQLHRLVAANTWLFGQEFTITLAEIGLTRAVSELVHGELDNAGATVMLKNGKSGRLDILLPRISRRSVGEGDLHLIVELKRPSHPLNFKDYVQVNAYANALCNHRAFVDTRTRWRFWLVGGSIADDLKFQVHSADRAPGCAHKFENGEIWIKSWGQLLEDNKEVMQFYKSRLDLAASEEEISKMLSDLYAKVLPGREPGAKIS